MQLSFLNRGVQTNYQSHTDGSRQTELSKGGRKASVNLDTHQSKVGDAKPPEETFTVTKKDGKTIINAQYVGQLDLDKLMAAAKGGESIEVNLENLDKKPSPGYEKLARGAEKFAVRAGAALFGAASGAALGGVVADVFQTAGSGESSETQTSQMRDRATTNFAKLEMADAFVKSGDLEAAFEARDKYIKSREKKGQLTDAQKLSIQNIKVENSGTGTITVL